MRKGLIACSAAMLVSGCVGGVIPRSMEGVGTAPPQTTTATRAPSVAPPRPTSTGLDSVLGLGAASLTRRFGEPRIDLAEGDARKLQFISEACVLDIYLYPARTNTAPVATHIEARQRSNGADVDKAACIRQVESAAKGR